METPKIDSLREIAKRVEAAGGRVYFSDSAWFDFNVLALWTEVDILKKLTVSETLLARMKEMVEIAAPDIQVAMQQLRSKLEDETAAKEQALAKIADLDKRLAARDGFVTQEARATMSDPLKRPEDSHPDPDTILMVAAVVTIVYLLVRHFPW